LLFTKKTKIKPKVPGEMKWCLQSTEAFKYISLLQQKESML